MAIFWDCLHMVGILFSMKHLLSFASSHLWDLGPILFVSHQNFISSSDFLVFS